jgi:tetratricopeptide (TPR) repeat protein
VDDGRSQGARPGTVHWQIARQLLENVTPAPASDPDVLLWYRAVSAHLFAEGNLAEASQHLDKARQMFPNHPQFLLDSAYLHLELSSPAVQASVQEIRASGGAVGVESRRSELQHAERFLRDTLSAAPGSVDARIRLGRTLGDLGRQADAAAELRKAIDAQPDPEPLYLAELFLGRAEHMLGRKDEAKRRYERASALYPDAQSPQLALAHLARESGDRAAAHRALRTITSPPEASPVDPWLWYYKPHREDAEALMQSMEAQLSSGSP